MSSSASGGVSTASRHMEYAWPLTTTCPVSPFEHHLRRFSSGALGKDAPSNAWRFHRRRIRKDVDELDIAPSSVL